MMSDTNLISNEKDQRGTNHDLLDFKIDSKIKTNRVIVGRKPIETQLNTWASDKKQAARGRDCVGLARRRFICWTCPREAKLATHPRTC